MQCQKQRNGKKYDEQCIHYAYALAHFNNPWCKLKVFEMLFGFLSINSA